VRLRSFRLALLLAGLLGSASCSPEEPGADRAAPAVATGAGASDPPGQEDESDAIARLSHLGYGEFDAEADPSLVGVVRHDRARAQPGYNLYGSGDHRVFVVDMQGERVHTLSLAPERQRTTFAELLADGTLAVLCNYQCLTRLDWDSRVLWESPVRAHHDIAERADGVLLVPYRKPERYRGRDVRFDGLTLLSAGGQPLSTWYTFEHLAELAAHHPPSPLDTPAQPGEARPERPPDYHHLNTVELLPETALGRRDRRFRAGNVLVCFRNLSVILVLDQDDWSVQWSFGRGELEGPHMPTMLPDGRILVFDNGVTRKWTRVIEVDPETNAIVWTYQGTPRESFFSELRGSAQRLANGNTLVCEADRGHVLEVTRAGEVVWEFWNPELSAEGRRPIYRCMRYPAERIEPLLARGR
jgi:hypothetical protein